MKKKLVLVGGGGHCKSVLDTLLRDGRYEEIVITDYDLPVGTMVMGCQVIGKDEMLPELFKSGYTEAFITVGSIRSTAPRRRLYEMVVQTGFSVPNIIDPSAVVSDFAELGSGIFIGKNAVVNADARIGDAAIINTGAVVEHECMIGEFTHVSVGAKLCGNVRIGTDTLIGAGSVVIQGITIGNNALIGAGSTVIGDVKDAATCVGLVRQDRGE